MAWTAPRTWVAAEIVTASNMNTHLRDNLKALGDAWTAYTPTWGSSGTAPAIGNGTLTGAWAQAGKFTAFSIKLVAGSTTTFGTGSYTLTLPFAPANKGRLPAGGSLADVSAGNIYDARLYWISSSAANLMYLGTNGVWTAVTNTAVVTWANTDEFVFSGLYEAA